MLLFVGPAVAALTTPPLLSADALHTISTGGVHIVRDWLPPRLQRELRADAEALHTAGLFTPDGLTNAAKSRADQGFSVKADRQTFRGDGWSAPAGDVRARGEFAALMRSLRLELSEGLGRPSLAEEGVRKHEMTYNWYEPGAYLGRHLDEHHEETKGPKGWTVPTRRSVTWLVYLNEDWGDGDGGSLRTYPRPRPASAPVGADGGNLQVGWVEGVRPVFLDAFLPDGGCSLYTLQPRGGGYERVLLSRAPFEVPPQPVDFRSFLEEGARQTFEQISTARLDPRFVNGSGGYGGGGGGGSEALASLATAPNSAHSVDVLPEAGKLVLFDSVSLPHLVREVTGDRHRVAATGWFHEDSQFHFEMTA